MVSHDPVRRRWPVFVATPHADHESRLSMMNTPNVGAL
jgi:hypothetical protein